MRGRIHTFLPPTGVAGLSRRTRTGLPRVYDTHRCRARHLIENLLAPKQFRRLAIRYDKLANHFAAFVILAPICIWMT